MQNKHYTTPLIPWLTENSEQFFMQAEGVPYLHEENMVPYYQDKGFSAEVTGKTGALALGASISLLSVSEHPELLRAGVIDRTDSVLPGVYITALYLTKHNSPVLRASCATAKADKARFTAPARPPRLGHWCQLLNCQLPFSLEFRLSETCEQLEFEVEVNGKLYLETGRIILDVNRQPGKELRIIRQSEWCIKNQPLFGYKLAGYELLAHRVNSRQLQSPNTSMNNLTEIHSLLPFPVNPDAVTFESAQNLENNDIEIPNVRVGHKGKLVAILFQYLNQKPSKEGILYGQWFALPVGKIAEKEILAIQPAGQSFEELKALIKEILEGSNHEFK